MVERFSQRVSVRAYELDSNGHVNGVVYLQYAEHSRWELMRAAGADLARLGELGVGPVFLETVIRYHTELFYGDTVDVSCEIVWGTGKTFRVAQRLVRTDGELVAEVDSVGGLLDLQTRKLVDRPAERYRMVATAPELLGL
ncbi:MAG TPA: acyl-CoA thioesterase [Actinophytocola sp.]|uniref:acyl-CoA thioesterase n=1 Tax=Actinophytocola sp. TaxID=1872138 RepID=UPI002DB93D5E|nr:acyl-CoA thioesterase [Actinophytocola sp.]HEU5469130.1 acyl-CoA thioesterase [Actinophytocola sp.]